MARPIPSGITRDHVEASIGDLDAGVSHRFGESRGYDLLYSGRRYPPKAVLGLAASRLLDEPLELSDFSGGVASRCVRVLRELGFTVVPKGSVESVPRAWLLIALPDEDGQHAGNLGYDDEVESVYRWDSKVPNSRQVQAGDLAVLRSDELIGLTGIEGIEESAGVNRMQRCPECKRTNIKPRKQRLPRYRCYRCKAEFAEPESEEVDVTLYAGRFGGSFVAAPGAVSVDRL